VRPMSPKHSPSKFEHRSQTQLEPSPHPRALHPGSRYAGLVRGNEYVRVINRYASGRLLDFGCGARPLHPWYEPVTSSSIGLDWSSDCRPDSVADLRETLPFKDGSFDTILATDVFEHLPDINSAFEECSRVLRPSGILIVGTPFLYMVHEAPHDFHRPTEFMLRLAAESFPLDVLEITPAGGAPDVMFDLLSKFVARGPTTGRICLSSFRAASKLGVIRRVSAQSASKFPMGYTSVFRRQ